MYRRTFLTALSATILTPLAATASSIEYMPGVLKERLDAGETVFLTFGAVWCSTCRAQERVMDKLKAANPSYVENIAFINVDWDTYGKSELAKRMKIPRRSTLVVLKGNEELGRIVAETREARIKELMDTALGAASA